MKLNKQVVLANAREYYGTGLNNVKKDANFKVIAASIIKCRELHDIDGEALCFDLNQINEKQREWVFNNL
jgi:hypothetical protein